MKIEVRETKTPGVIQITTLDERWYRHPDHPDIDFSSWTWVAGCYPKGIQFYKWIASKGWDESQAIKQSAGEKGSRVHKGIEILLAGGPLRMNDVLPDNDGNQAEFSVEEWECLMSFADWFKDTKPEILQTEQSVFNFTLNHAGTLDLKCKIGEDIWIIDFKTGQNLWPEYEVQVNGYKSCENMEDVTKMGILRIGYKANKRHWKLDEIDPCPQLVQAAHEIWLHEYGNVKPRQMEYPTELCLIEKPASKVEPLIESIIDKHLKPIKKG